MYRPFLYLLCAMILLIPFTHAGDEQTHGVFGRLPESFDPPFAPQNIDPESATISLSPGFENGRYDIHISLSETTLYDASHQPGGNYGGEIILQGIKLPTDDFQKLTGREFKNAADERSQAVIEFTKIARRDEKAQRPLAQRYPIAVQSLRFGPVHRYVVYAELYFQVDFAAVGPPNPWTKMASVDPYQQARMRAEYPKDASQHPGYSKAEWEAFCALVRETESRWSKAKYSTHIRFLLNHRYESSNGMNTHER
jgi:hypothetical protein